MKAERGDRREHAPVSAGAASNGMRQQGRAIIAPAIMTGAGAKVKSGGQVLLILRPGEPATVRVEAASENEQNALAELLTVARRLAGLVGRVTP